MTFPVHDWQFWVVTIIAAFAAWMVLRMVWPPGWWPRRRKAASHTTTLTVGGKTPKKR
jgi:hypothetical protein